MNQTGKLCRRRRRLIRAGIALIATFAGSAILFVAVVKLAKPKGELAIAGILLSMFLMNAAAFAFYIVSYTLVVLTRCDDCKCLLYKQVWFQAFTSLNTCWNCGAKLD